MYIFISKILRPSSKVTKNIKNIYVCVCVFILLFKNKIEAEFFIKLLLIKVIELLRS